MVWPSASKYFDANDNKKPLKPSATIGQLRKPGRINMFKQHEEALEGDLVGLVAEVEARLVAGIPIEICQQD